MFHFTSKGTDVSSHHVVAYFARLWTKLSLLPCCPLFTIHNRVQLFTEAVLKILKDLVLCYMSRKKTKH